MAIWVPGWAACCDDTVTAVIISVRTNEDVQIARIKLLLEGALVRNAYRSN